MIVNTFRHNAERKAFENYVASCSPVSLANLADYVAHKYGDDSKHLEIVNKALDRAAAHSADAWAYECGHTYS